MGLLDESLTPGQSGHIAHQEQVHKKLNGLVYDVKADFGAAGDGATNDTAAVQAAITAASAAGGGTVWFPEGTYQVHSTIALASNVWLRGVGASSVIRRPAATGAGLSLIGGDTLSNCGVADLKVDGGAVNLSGNGVVHLIECTNSGVERVQFRGGHATTPAVVFEGTTACWAVHNDIDGTGYGVVVGSNSAALSPETNDNLIGWNTIRNTPLDSIFVTASLGSTATAVVGHRNKVVGNTVTGCGDAGIESGVGMIGNIIEGNTVDGSDGPNILVRDNDGCQIIGNLCTGNTTEGAGNYGGGIAVLDQTDVSRDISIVGNTCRDNTGAGIMLGPDSTLVGRDFLVSGNRCRDNGGPGIYAWRCPGTAITGNLCAFNGSHGIYVRPVSATGEGNMTVTGNTCDGNTGHGIRVDGQYVVVVGNRCFNSSGTAQTHGIGLATSQANYVTVMANVLEGNATAAISDDAAGIGHTIFNNKGHDNNRVFESGAFSLDVTSNLNVGNNLAIVGNVGFYGTFPAAKPTITGSRGGNAALADLLTKLATLGLITDSSSA